VGVCPQDEYSQSLRLASAIQDQRQLQISVNILPPGSLYR
jgi:hypothetical protein